MVSLKAQAGNGRSTIVMERSPLALNVVGLCCVMFSWPSFLASYQSGRHCQHIADTCGWHAVLLSGWFWIPAHSFPSQPFPSSILLPSPLHSLPTPPLPHHQAASFAALDKAELSVWEALGLLGELPEYETALLADGVPPPEQMGLVEHAFQTAELCRLAHPELEWLPLVGLIHGLGKLLAHTR